MARQNSRRSDAHQRTLSGGVEAGDQSRSRSRRAHALVGASDNRPVLITGKRLVGKTAIVHEFVRRRMDRRRSSETTMHIGSRGSIADLAGDA